MDKIKLGEISLIIIIFAVFALVIFAQVSYYFNIDSELSAKRPENGFSTALPAVHDEDEVFGNLEIATRDGFALTKANILINGLICGNFKNGSVLVRVYEGDVVVIDTAAYDKEIEFILKNYSKNIDVDKLNAPFISRDGKVALGVISFK